MKLSFFIVLTFCVMSHQQIQLSWIIEPTYDEIIVYGEESFVAKVDETYKVLDYDENTLYTFSDREILGIGDHTNEGGELQEIIHVNYVGNKSRLFNIKTLKFLHEEKYYLLQTEGYYEPERRLIRIFDEKKEGVMDFDGNMILEPNYKGVVVDKDFKIGFKEDEIFVYDFENTLIQKLPYPYKGVQYIKQKQLFRVQKAIEGKTNVYEEERIRKDGLTKVEYKEIGEHKMVCGIVDRHNTEIIPFEYSSIYIKSDEFLQVTKNEKITTNGVAISYFKPKVGIIDYTNKVVLPIEYKYIGVNEGGFVQVENYENKRAVFNLNARKFETNFIYNTYEQAAHKMAELDESKDFISFKENDLEGLKKKKGEILIPAQYSSVSSTMHPEIFIIYGASDDEYGYQGYYHIGLKKEIVPTLFADRGGIGGEKRHSQQNVISVMDPETGEIGFYKIDGTKISDPKFDEYVDGFSEDLAPVYIDYSEKTALMDINGNMVYDYIFDSMTLPLDGKSIAGYNGKVGILNLKGMKN